MITAAKMLVLETLAWVFCFVYLISPEFIRRRMDDWAEQFDG